MASNSISRWLSWPRTSPCLHVQQAPSPSRLLPSSQSFIQTASFSTTPSLQKRKNKNQATTDPRIKLIRYALYHPALPRPLRFSRNRSLRHWTIHRAWNLFRAKERAAQQQDLENLYNSMRDACEALRHLDEAGMSEAIGQGGKDQGRLFRIAMMKRGVWSGEKNSGSGVPIEYARAQTEYPSREGWNYAWRR
ncbi:hypothetical protein NA57DRAFT_77746 [Rhizodiscina lignyota]|uniref:Large ribosomal subunit protein mL40 n=1 Tax=Rhizodiscina lignyota TaxID=1504668 RepID=A0A9P4IEB5_9PEZI|nr:hypothetical protein NA57DRAFT_77746 [Rhizodiscina lignyota]